MYSTTTLTKSSKFTGRIMGTHQQLDLAARKVLGKQLPRAKYFPSGKEIIHFEGTRGPDGLKRKSPGEDEPSHLLDSARVLAMDHRWNLVEALKSGNRVRAAFEAAWMGHMVADSLTPAHHFPLSEVQDELMTDKEMLRVFGEPIKGVMHGRSLLETMRNNWLYWGAGGHMTQHIAYEYGVLMIAATIPEKAMIPKVSHSDFEHLDPEAAFDAALKQIQALKMYDRFRADGWTTDLAIETKDLLLPTIVKTIAQLWYSAAAEAYGLETGKRSGRK